MDPDTKNYNQVTLYRNMVTAETQIMNSRTFYLLTKGII